MRTKILLLLGIFLGVSSFSQTNIYFDYDQAGNQKYRGTVIIPNSQTSTQKNAAEFSLREISKEEEQFWTGIKLFPVPVKDVLTVRWTDALDELIENVSLYEHQTINWNFFQKNIKNLNKEIQVDMQGYYLGVYIIKFQLKDGRVYSRNII